MLVKTFLVLVALVGLGYLARLIINNRIENA